MPPGVKLCQRGEKRRLLSHPLQMMAKVKVEQPHREACEIRGQADEKHAAQNEVVGLVVHDGAAKDNASDLPGGENTHTQKRINIFKNGWGMRML